MARSFSRRNHAKRRKDAVGAKQSKYEKKIKTEVADFQVFFNAIPTHLRGALKVLVRRIIREKYALQKEADKWRAGKIAAELRVEKWKYSHYSKRRSHSRYYTRSRSRSYTRSYSQYSTSWSRSRSSTRSRSRSYSRSYDRSRTQSYDRRHSLYYRSCSLCP